MLALIECYQPKCGLNTSFSNLSLHAVCFHVEWIEIIIEESYSFSLGNFDEFIIMDNPPSILIIDFITISLNTE